LHRRHRLNFCTNTVDITAIPALTLPPQLLWLTNAIAATTARMPPSLHSLCQLTPPLPQPMRPPQTLHQPTSPLPQPMPPPQSLCQRRNCRNRCTDTAITTIVLQRDCHNRCANTITTIAALMPPLQFEGTSKILNNV
jgi:hypothetical protein